MKRTIIIISAAMLFFTLAVSSHAGLADRGNGLIYDSDLNRTWLHDANYAGLTLTWDEATNWVTNLVFGGFDDWRLPSSDTCSGNACTGSEMGHLFYIEGITSGTQGLFTNVKPSMYWASAESESNPSQAYRFSFLYGTQGVSDKTTKRYALAVRDGDISSPVAPEPVSSILFLTGGTILAARRYHGKTRKSC